MTEDDHRTPIAVPPPERVYRKRRGARIVVRTPYRVLLMSDTDPGVPGSKWWVTPGGGLDAGESFEQAAVRELFEETGLRVAVADLIGPLARRVVVHGYSDRVLEQTEEFFMVQVPAPFEPDTAGFTAKEQVTLIGSGWFTLDELSDLTIWPAELVQLLTVAPGGPVIDWGRVEESTVAVGLGHR